MRYHAFWEKIQDAPKVKLEYLRSVLTTWSGVAFGWDENYTWPVADFKKLDAERMLRGNPELFRVAERINHEQKPVVEVRRSVAPIVEDEIKKRSAPVKRRGRKAKGVR